MPFKKGAFHLAKSQGIPLIPVAISGTEKVLPKHGKLKSGKVRILVGNPILTEEMEKMTVPELRQFANDRLAALLLRLEVD
jgi:1-acyl-sn-glycerol-3-phosphate acyltransferase